MPTSLRRARINRPAVHNVTCTGLQALHHTLSLSRIHPMQRRSNRPTPPGWPPRSMQPRATPGTQPPRQPDQYDSFNASLLYCGHCRQATPTRQRLLLVLPTGNLYEYFCAQCGTSTGSKTESAAAEGGLLSP